MAFIYNLTDLWNNNATTYTAIKMNVSDGGSASASLLMDLQVGGSSKASIDKTGKFIGPTAAGGSQISFSFASDTTSGIYRDGTTGHQGFVQGNTYFLTGLTYATGFGLASSLNFGWCSTDNGKGTLDLILGRNAAASLRLGATDAAAPVAQTLGVQSVVAGTSNIAGANFTIKGSAGTGTGAGGSIVFQVAPAGSTGTAQNAFSDALTIASNRSVTIAAGSATLKRGATANYLVYENSSFDVFQVTAGEFWFPSNALVGFGDKSNTFTSATMDVVLRRDAANTLALRNGTSAQTFNLYSSYTDASNYARLSAGVLDGGGRIYIVAENAGTGTARGINIRAATAQDVVIGIGAVDIYQFKTSGLLFGVDNTYDIGASGANRPRTAYFGTSIEVAASPNTNVINNNGLMVGANSSVYWSGRSVLQSPVNGRVLINNNAGTDFDRLMFGSTTSSFPALKRVSANLQVIAADGISSAGFIVGNQALATTATDGFLYIPTCAGTPTGVPTTQTGTAPLVVDSTNNKLYVYVGGAWTAMN